MKKNLNFFFVIFVILIAAGAIFFFKNAAKIDGNPRSSQLEKIILETKESNEGAVIVTIKPLSLDSFEIILDTHSEELDADMVTISELVTDQGKSYNPTSWEGTPPGGHHRQGILKFNPISPEPKTIEIKIKNVGGIEERSFKWNL